MNKTPLILALFAVLTAGCVTRTTYANAPRQKVRFASQSATETFFNSYLAANYPAPANTNAYEIWVGIPFYVHKGTEATDNVRFNRAIAAADNDHDGVITDAEAQAYAAQATLPAGESPEPDGRNQG